MCCTVIIILCLCCMVSDSDLFHVQLLCNKIIGLWYNVYLQVAMYDEDMESVLCRLSITNGKMFVHVSVLYKYMVLLKSYKNYNSITTQAYNNLIQHGQRIWAMLKIAESFHILWYRKQSWTWPGEKGKEKICGSFVLAILLLKG